MGPLIQGVQGSRKCELTRKHAYAAEGRRSGDIDRGPGNVNWHVNVHMRPEDFCFQLTYGIEALEYTGKILPGGAVYPVRRRLTDDRCHGD